MLKYKYVINTSTITGNTFKLPITSIFQPKNDLYESQISNINIDKLGGYNDIVDNEIVKVIPVSHDNGVEINSLKFNINLYNKDSGWGDGGSNILSVGFTEDDIKNRTNRLNKTFIRLSFYDTNNIKTQNLLFYSTIYLNSGEIYGNYIISGGTNNIKLNFRTENPNTTNSLFSSEGFYLYLHKDYLTPTNQYNTIYLKVELNSAIDGRTILMLRNKPSNTDGFYIGELYDNIFIPIKCKFDDINDKYIYWTDNNTNGTIELYQAKVTKPLLTTPIVTAFTETNISSDSIAINGGIVDNGHKAIIERGFYVSDTSNINNTNTKIISNAINGNIFSYYYGNLNPNSPLYYKSYATNSIGTSLSDNEITGYTLPIQPIIYNTSLLSNTENSLTLQAITTLNPPYTKYSFKEMNTNKYIQKDKSLGNVKYWDTSVGFNNPTITGLTSNTAYDISINAINENGVETPYFEPATLYTKPTKPITPITISDITQDSFKVYFMLSDNYRYLIHEVNTNKFMNYIADGIFSLDDYGSESSGFNNILTGLTSNTTYILEATRIGLISGERSEYGDRVTATTLSYVNTPTKPIITGVTDTYLYLNFGENSNPSNTVYLIHERNTHKYVQGNRSLGTSETWFTHSQWGSVQVNGLTPHTNYSFEVKGKDVNGRESLYSPYTDVTTSYNSRMFMGETTPNKPNSDLACAGYISGRAYYTSSDGLIIGNTLFDDITLQTPTNGGGYYIALSENGNGSHIWVQINNVGLITGLGNC